MEVLDQLEKLAKEARPHGWFTGDGVAVFGFDDKDDATAQFTLAANPATVLALIEVVREANNLTLTQPLKDTTKLRKVLAALEVLK